MRTPTIAALVLTALAAGATPILAQGAPKQAGAPAPAAAASATSQARDLWATARDYILQTAEDVPDSLYSFRPTPEVRSFGELFGHLAGSQNMFCAMALGEKPPAESAVEDSAKTKPALVAALRASNDYCARAYAQSDAAAARMTNVFGQQRARLYALMMNATHDNEHYGNLVTYMRINHIVPPSSRRQ